MADYGEKKELIIYIGDTKAKKMVQYTCDQLQQDAKGYESPKLKKLNIVEE